MKIIGLTGGIGSGKSTVAHFFKEKGIPVYDSDSEAKCLLNDDEQLKNQIIQVFGEEAYLNDEYNRSFISSKVFQDKDLLSQLNAITHPAIRNHFQSWVKRQTTDFVIKEAAILFESGAYKDCDSVICVVANEDLRIQRVMDRSHLSAEEIKKRIQNQWTDAQKIERSDFVITNNSDLETLEFNFQKLYKELLNRFQTS